MPEFPVFVAANILQNHFQMELEELEELTDSEEHEDESEGEDDEDVPDGDELAMEDVGELQVLLDILEHNDESEGEVDLDENTPSLTSDRSDSNSIGSDLSLDWSDDAKNKFLYTWFVCPCCPVCFYRQRVDPCS